MLCLSSTSIVSRMGNLSRHQFRTLERKYNDYYCYCVCLFGIAMFEDDGMLRSVAVLGSVVALYRGCSVVFAVGSVLGVYVLFTHWFGLVVPFVCLFFCIPAHPLVYVFNCSFFDT